LAYHSRRKGRNKGEKMENKYWRGRKKEHDWLYMGVDVETGEEYSMCDLCNEYRKDDLKITKKEWEDRYKQKKVSIDGKIYEGE
jgi:hypothetical protein